MITLSCEEVRREISNYLDDDMSPRMRRLLEAHLDQCRKCAVLLDSTHNVLVLLADEQRFELPDGFSSRVRQMLAKEFENRKS
jgi:predicted anti-sigma-YlaC factor YlaD